ncbi:hypothetical protein [Moraxella nonliquefaciens]|uniref:Uncharacterized protein n=1 Tax=Moraxella nonliquefaciens TaxID=478 RepID=A0A1B8QSP0_MORNO|nr:hypothetical protein [Moraxella nonliquefaciens]OBX87839.1 hypothetical protein A7456_07290 [Moraxella nonliquefaciens]QPT45448.1 hypothetical protein I6G26_05595 [Moraxella nonliquefaciens]QQC30481.1 hypothetical protein I6H63_04385 [Moraxella nonliquefaciens]
MIENARLWQLPYTHLLDDFSHEQLKNTDDYVLVLAKRPNSLQQSFEIWAKLANETTEQYAGIGQFIAHATVQNAVEQTSQITTLTLDEIDDGLAYVGQCALLNDEIVQIVSIDTQTNQLTIKRGCVDTVPTAHANLSQIWFYGDMATVVERAFIQGQTVHAKLLSQTSQNILDMTKATRQQLLIGNRHVLPFAPADIKINDLPYPNQIQTINKISWVGRNKISQDVAILDQTAPHYDVETGTTFSVAIFKKTTPNGNYRQVAVRHGMVATSLNIVKENPTNDETKLVAKIHDAVMIKVELWAVKDGLESWQRHSIEMAVV